MNLQNLRTFILASQLGSFSAAANELGYAPSTITLHIQQLEAEWGVALFEKQGRGIRLTQEGRTLLGKAHSIINQAEALDRTVQEMTTGDAGHIRLGAVEPVGSWQVAPLLAEYIRERPLLQINFESGSGYTLRHQLMEGHLDVAVMFAPTPGWPLHFDPLFIERNALLMWDDHPLAERDVVEYDDLRDQRLIFLETPTAYRQVVEHDLVAHGGTHPYANIEVSSVRAAIAFVRERVGIAVLPPICVQPVPPGMALRPIGGFGITRIMGLMYRDYDSMKRKALDKFIMYVGQHLYDM